MPQHPLTDRELRILRGMIDEYEAHQTRNRFVREWFGDLRFAAIVVSGCLVFVVQCVTLYLLLRGGKP